MEIHPLEKSYLNISGQLFDSEFINLVNINDDKIDLDERTLFLTRKEKEILNAHPIMKFDDAIYVFKYDNRYGIIGDVPIKEYREGKIKCHELVIPETVQGMLSNLHGYNCEAAPILLGTTKKVDFEHYINRMKYEENFNFNGLEIFVFRGDEARKITKEYESEEFFYVADGHHRLYTTSLTHFKHSVLTCLISFDYLEILPIHRVIQNIDSLFFETAKEFIYNRFEVFPEDTPLSKGKVRIVYGEDNFVVKLIDLNSDAFWNNDIYRLNTQIISQAFRIFEESKIKYFSNEELGLFKESKLTKKDVIIETYPISKKEFIECANNNCIMPPKSTWFFPKFPSFLVFKKYK